MSADLDREIDRAVRSLLDVAPPLRLRARVLASLEPRPRRSFSGRSLVPIAAVAIVLLMVLVLRPWRSEQAPPDSAALKPPAAETTTAEAHGSRPPAIVEPTPIAPREAVTNPRAASRPARARSTAVPLIASARESDTAGIAALAHPAPLSVESIGVPEVMTMPSIQPAPLRVTALDLRALEMPPDAARGADR